MDRRIFSIGLFMPPCPKEHMNMLFEGLQERGALIVVPSSAVETMNLGGMAGLTALAQNAETMISKADSDSPNPEDEK